jgi:hypothetical protein
MNSLDIALQNIQNWLYEAQANNVKQSYKLWRENGVWYSAVNSLIMEN